MIKLQTLLTISIVKEAETHHLMIRYDCKHILEFATIPYRNTA
jgi:hypothetical protein